MLLLAAAVAECRINRSGNYWVESSMQTPQIRQHGGLQTIPCADLSFGHAATAAQRPCTRDGEGTTHL
jgi:hypothetical protein